MSVIVFDVNETLLDLEGVRPHFERIFGNAAVASKWFAQLLQSSMVATITDRYVDFGALAKDALAITGKRVGIEIDAAEQDAVLGAMRRLPPHRDVPAALTRLKAAGFRLAALTNSPPAVLQEQLGHSKLSEFFELMLSVDAVKRFKPHRDVYLMAAKKLEIQPNQLRMVAAHNWDVTGAIRAGCLGAFVARPGMALGEFDEPVDIVGVDMGDVVQQIIAKDRP